MDNYQLLVCWFENIIPQTLPFAKYVKIFTEQQVDNTYVWIDRYVERKIDIWMDEY